jgi:outer membrane receptor for ferrienterochelin and colicins
MFSITRVTAIAPDSEVHAELRYSPATACAKTLILLALSLGAQGAAAVRAAEVEFADMSLKQLMALEVFTAASLLPTEYSLAPGTVYSFNRADFARLGVRRLDDLLQFVPGIQLNQYRKRHRSIWARGVLDRYNDKLVLMVDGVRMRHLYYNHFSLGDELALEKVERVEIVMGPASSLYGANAFGGVISVTTRSLGATPALEGTLETADNSRLKGSLLYNSEAAQLFGSFVSQDAPFRRDRTSFIGGETLQPLEESYGNLFLKFRPLEGLTLSLDYQQSDTPFLFIPSTQDAFVEQRPLTVAARFEHGDLALGRIESSLYYTQDRAREYEIEQNGRRLAYLEHQDATLAGAALTGFRRLFDDHVLALGLSWQHEQADDTGFVRYLGFDGRFLDAPLRGSLLSDPDVSNDDFALFVQNVWRVAPQLGLTLGGRYDSYDAFGDHFNYRAALVYTPDNRQVWKLMYGTAHRTPSLREYLKVLEGTDFVAPVPRPEYIRSLELGFLYQWDRANLGLTLFRNEIDDYIHEVPASDSADEYYTNSAAPWKLQGVEALVQLRLDHRLHLRLGGAYLDAHQERGSGRLPYLADWSASTNLSYNYQGGHRAGISLIYSNTRPDTAPEGAARSGASTLLNLHADGPLAGDLSYAVGVDNLLDIRVQDPAADFGNLYNTQRPGREIWARLEWRPGI